MNRKQRRAEAKQGARVTQRAAPGVREMFAAALQNQRAGRLGEAERLCRRVLAADSRHADSLLLLGAIACQVGRHVVAVDMIGKAIAINAKVAAYHGNLGVALQKLGRLDEAVGCYRKAIELSPDQAEVQSYLGGALAEQGRLDEALASYRKSFAMDNTNIPAISAAAEVLVAQGRLDEAQTHIDSYMCLAADDPGMYEIAGRLAMMREQYDKAAGYFQQAHDLDYKNVFYIEALAGANFAAGKYSEAAMALKTLLAAKDAPDSRGAKTASPTGDKTSWHTMLGDCYIAMNRNYEARDEYQIVSELAPAEVSSWVNLAKAALKIGDVERARMSARRAFALDGNDADAALILSFALLRDNAGDDAEPGPSDAKARTEAIFVLKKAIGVHGDNAMLHCVLGTAYARGGNQAEAIKCYQAARRIQPGNQTAQDLLDAATAKKVSTK